MLHKQKKSDERKTNDRVVEVKRQTLEDQFQMGKLNLCGNPDPNRYYHVFIDKGGKVDRMKRRGYRVEDGSDPMHKVWLGDMNPTEVGSLIATVANPNSDGSRGVLMSCPREYKEEDDAYRQKLVDDTEAKIYHNQETYTDEHGEGSRYGKIERK